MAKIYEANLHEAFKLGLLNMANGKLLTVENFNNEVNISGVTLKKRQVWTILVDKKDVTSDLNKQNPIYIMSSFGKLLAADRDGKVTCSSTNPGKNEKFILDYNESESGLGEFAIKSFEHNYYLTGNDHSVQCFSKTVKYWIMRIAIHPQINLKHSMRNRYVRLRPDGDELRSDLDQPWGVESLIRFHQLPLPNTPMRSSKNQDYGQVALCTDDSLYLKPDGSLSTELDDENMFTLELRPGNPTLFAFRHVKTRHYLSAIGPGTIKLKSNLPTTKSREEFFMIERGTFQVSIVAFNDKFVSMKQGMDISANQREIADSEIFQLEYLGPTKNFFDGVKLIQSSLESAKDSFDESFESSLRLNNNNNNNNICSKLTLNKTHVVPVQNVNNIERTYDKIILSTGNWRLRTRDNTIIKFKNNLAVQHHKNSTDDSDGEFEMHILSGSSEPGGLILVNKGGQCVSAKKLGAVSCNNSTTSQAYPNLQQTDPLAEEVFRIYPIINRRSIILKSAYTGAFVTRSPTQSKVKIAGIPLECSGPSHETFFIKKFKRGTFQLFIPDNSDQSKSWLVWNVTEHGVYLHKSEKVHNLEEFEELEEPDVGTEFLFVQLGQGQVLIRAVLDQSHKHLVAFLKVELKGEIKYDTSAIISPSMLWEL